MRIERELSTSRGGKVVIYIENPRQSDRAHEFYCKIGVEGDGIKEGTTIFGIDSMQATMLAIRHLESFVLRASKLLEPERLTWELGIDENDFGLGLTEYYPDPGDAA